ncbi:sigma-70 family RNA polymerase sigma factor [Amycolatopsis magusensis]|uniref:sigma-70 family RNA polymerase sigma factor n=1 Tax=Amycolatopsis magusensis TaxID=882444 RepID=UPI00379340F3
MATVPADVSGQSDAELIASVRAGTISAYGQLYERHVNAAYNLARQLSRSPAEADDLVSEAFAKVLDTLRAGKGPDTAFRAYLLTALRHTAYDKTRKDKRLDLNEDMSTVGAEALTVQFSDTALSGLERTMAAKAFARLPERWQAVLWHTEIEQQTPAEVAPLLGLTANGVSALAYRAREGLRQAYLQVHLAETSAERCRAAADRLGAWTRDGLSKRERAQVETHLDECERCRALAAELADVNGALRSVVAPLVLGGAVFAYLAAAGATKASAATAGTAAVGAAAAGAGAASSGGSGGAVANLASSGPRQFIGIAVSGVAVAAAVAAALASGGGPQIPAALEQPPAVIQPVAPPQPQPQPDPPAPPVVVPPAPAEPAPEPAPEPVPEPEPAPAPAPEPEPEPAPEPEPSPPPTEPEEPPAPPNIIATPPPSSLELTPGGGPVDIPFTVNNSGGTVSEPVLVTLNLPPGVSSVPIPGGGGGVGASARQLPGVPTVQVNCPPGSGTVTCTTATGLLPGQGAVLTFRLVADGTADESQVTGSVSSGGALPVAVKVPVKAAPDDVKLTVGKAWTSSFPWARQPVLHISLHNAGPTIKPATVTVSSPARLVLGTYRATCTTAGGTTNCASKKAMNPGERLHLWVLLDKQPHQDVTVTVTAKLGKDSESKTVQFDCWGRKCTPPSSSVTPTPPSTTKPTKPTTTPPSSKPSEPPSSPPSSGGPSTPEPPRQPAPPPPPAPPAVTPGPRWDLPFI